MIRHFALLLIQTYRVLSAAIHFLVGIFGFDTQCKFPECCSDFALRQFQTRNQSFVVSVQRIALRLILCSPISSLIGEGVKSRWTLVQ